MSVAEIKTEEDYTKAINDKNIAVVHFWADFAQECRTMMEVMTKLSKDSTLNNVKYYKLEAEEMLELSMKHEIVAVPTLLLFRAGKAIDRVDGANAAELTKKVKSHSIAKVDSLPDQNASQILSTIVQNKLTSNHLPMISPARNYSSEAPSLPPTIDYDELKLLLENDEILLIDVRNPEELEDDREINKAMSVPLPELKSALAMSPEQLYGEYGLHHHGLLSPSTPIVFTCHLGMRSGMACDIALEAGYTNVSNYTGGWRDWSQRH